MLHRGTAELDDFILVPSATRSHFLRPIADGYPVLFPEK